MKSIGKVEIDQWIKLKAGRYFFQNNFAKYYNKDFHKTDT